MHIHLPKVFHGWREFAKEVGIIVVGVLIALGFEQVVEEWRWRNEVRTTREAFVNELSYDALFASERVAVERCLRDRITSLTAKLNGSGGHWTADPMMLGAPTKSMAASLMVTGIPSAYRPPKRPYLGEEWEAAKSSGALDHMSRDDVHNFEFIYKGMDNLRALEDQEMAIEPEVSFLSFDQRLDPQSRVQATISLARLDSLNSWTALIARQTLATIRSMHLQLGMVRRTNRPDQTFEAARLKLMAQDRDRFGACVDPRPLV